MRYGWMVVVVALTACGADVTSTTVGLSGGTAGPGSSSDVTDTGSTAPGTTSDSDPATSSTTVDHAEGSTGGTDDSGDGDATTSPVGEETTSGSTTAGAGSTTGHPSETTGAETTTGAVQPSGGWLLSVENQTQILFRIHLDNMTKELLCTVGGADVKYLSLSFNADGMLMAFNGNGDFIELIDPCTCDRQVVTVSSLDFLSGLAWDGVGAFWGIDHAIDHLVTVDPVSGDANLVGPLGVDFGGTGAVYLQAEDRILAINAKTDKLYEIDPATGTAALIGDTGVDFKAHGIEVNPDDGEVYACNNDGGVYWIDTASGAAVSVGSVGYANLCTNLAAPVAAVDCLGNP